MISESRRYSLEDLLGGSCLWRVNRWVFVSVADFRALSAENIPPHGVFFCVFWDFWDGERIHTENTPRTHRKREDCCARVWPSSQRGRDGELGGRCLAPSGGQFKHHKCRRKHLTPQITKFTTLVTRPICARTRPSSEKLNELGKPIHSPCGGLLP